MKPTAANALELPETVWKAASDRTLGVQDPYTIEVSTLAGGTVAGPMKIVITIAQATIKGSIYYNSYISSAPSAAASSAFQPVAGPSCSWAGSNVTAVTPSPRTVSA